LETRNALKTTDLCNYSQRQEFRAQPSSERNKKRTQKWKGTSAAEDHDWRLGPQLQPHYQNIMEDDQINWAPAEDDRLQDHTERN